MQVLVYRRGLERWDELAAAAEPRPAALAGAALAPGRRRFDPRVVALAAAVSFGLLLASTAWALLAAVAAWLAIAWVAARPDREPLPAGLLFAALLAGGAFVFALGGGLGLDVAARRAIRAGLLVMTATWLRGAAGAEGLREVFRRVLGRLRRIPSAPEAAVVLDQISSEGRLAEAARALERQLRGVPKRLMPFVDAVLGWVVSEAAVPHPAPERRPLTLRCRWVDALLLATAALPALALS
jgi:hypothetical protein